MSSGPVRMCGLLIEVDEHFVKAVGFIICCLRLLVIVDDCLRPSIHRDATIHSYSVRCVIDSGLIGHLLVASQVFEDERVLEDAGLVLWAAVHIGLILFLLSFDFDLSRAAIVV